MGDFKYIPTPLMLPTSRYDERRADFAVGFISMLKHTTGEWYGKPFHLMPWQEQIVRDIFGIVDADGYRQFRTAYVEVGKKNGKSELAAAIALYLLFADGEAGAEVYSCAADINQASIVFNTAKAMVEQCGDLAKLSKLVPSTKRIIFPHTNSFYRVLSSETKSKQGFNVSGLIFDELFAQQTRELFDKYPLKKLISKHQLLLQGKKHKARKWLKYGTFGQNKNHLSDKQSLSIDGV